jgi:hypothetical protein
LEQNIPLKNYSSGVTLNFEFFLLWGLHGTFFYFKIGLFESNVAGGYLVLPVRSICSSFPFFLMAHSFVQFPYTPTVAQILGQRQSPPFVTIFQVYISFSHSLFREIIVPEGSLQKPVQITVHLKNSQPWPSQKQNNPLPNTVIFITIIPDLKLHPYTP